MISYNCAAELNAIINHPDVIKGHLCGTDADSIDVTPALDRGGFGSIGEGYGFVFDRVGNGIVEVHTSVMPTHRHRSAEITAATMDEVFTDTDTVEIVTRIKDNRPARMLATHVGMRKTFDHDGFEFFAISIWRWASAHFAGGTLGKQLAAMTASGNSAKAEWLGGAFNTLTGRI